ncbi:osmoprotectant NAGGN system M42 family peptidase [Oceanibacterium hippocampi]|uniref:Aminopeptidase YpdE n=1 Tax=Oceanibacterium hippocampi TaxID=745714 RepID=A0A1Y5SQK5_9PROT|nr:osmoprotectant NAGGN system M42 family peptidase [Oceanibacterium hippocampi]SLN45658.1 Aminopeptidase YpdE [Oceanibacterium hippocampi]
MSDYEIDAGYLQHVLESLLACPSPSGMTDAIVRQTCHELDMLDIPYELTRRGAIRATVRGKGEGPTRAIAAHLDTLGAMVKGMKPNGRLRVVPIGTWSARFAEGARVSIHCEDGLQYRGTILPLKASGHTYDTEIDSQPSDWGNLEIRIDARCHSEEDIARLGIRVGDFVAIDSVPEFSPEGFINARHLDDKAGVASLLAAASAVQRSGITPAVDSHLLFTISEEVGVGASNVLHGEVAEMVAIDNGTIAPGQYTSEYGATIAMKDSSGPFDRNLTLFLESLCQSHDIPYSRDVFLHYRSDAAAALEAGNDIRTALLCFALDASHGYERTHRDSLIAIARLLAAYMLAPPMFAKEEMALGPQSEFPLIEGVATDD